MLNASLGSQTAVHDENHVEQQKFFILCTMIGALIGPFVTHYMIAPLVADFNALMIFQTLLIGTSVGGICGFLVAMTADVIISGRLEEDAVEE